MLMSEILTSWSQPFHLISNCWCFSYLKQFTNQQSNKYLCITFVASLLIGCLPGFLQPETVTELWNIVANTEGQGHKDGGYGLGWVVIPEKQDFGASCHQSETVLHSGAAVGASSILLIRPTVGAQPLKGVVVAVLVNLQKVNLEKTAMAVAACFQKTQSL